MHMTAILAGLSATVALAAPALAGDAQDSPPRAATPLDAWQVALERPANVADLLTRLDRDARFAGDGAAKGAGAWSTQWAASSRDVWFGNAAGHDDRLRLRAEGPIRRLDGSPLPPGPLDPAALDARHYDLSYTRGWTETLAQTGSGLAVTLTPHVGLGMGSRGGTTEAGATLRIGRGIEKLVPNGGDAFGERPRWYLYAAGSGRAVGYNFARNRDGDFARSGVSQDSGAFLGDASLGVALRRGPIHSSLSIAYREIQTEGLRAGHGVDTDVSEGVIAFQLSIKPD